MGKVDSWNRKKSTLFCLFAFLMCQVSIPSFRGSLQLILILNRKSKHWKMILNCANCCYSPYVTFVPLIFLIYLLISGLDRFNTVKGLNWSVENIKKAAGSAVECAVLESLASISRFPFSPWANPFPVGAGSSLTALLHWYCNTNNNNETRRNLGSFSVEKVLPAGKQVST